MLGAVTALLVFGLLVVASRALAYLAGERRPSVVVSIAVALLVLGLAGWGRLTQDLRWASLPIALCSLAVITFAWRRGPRAPPPPRGSTRLGRAGWLGVLSILFFGGYCVFQGYWWDEYSCHFPVAASLARGILPAEHPLFPGEPFRYHYAFDLLAGWVRALTGAHVALALDVVSLGMLALLLAVAVDLGASLRGPRGARLMPVVLLLGGGTLYFLLYRDAGSIEVHWDLLPRKWQDSTPPPTISNFFQHPQAMGMPLALAALMLFDRPLDDPHRHRRTALAAAVMAALSLSQIVFFGTMGLVLAVSTVVFGIRQRRGAGIVIDGAWLLASLGVAFLLGGFLAPGPRLDNMLLFGRSMFTDPWLQVLAYHLVVFGLPWLALPFLAFESLRRPDPLRLPVTLAAVFGFALPHVATYARSWDIVKFLGVGAFFANILFADLLARGLRPPRPPSRAAVGLVLALVTFSSWVFLLRMGVLDGHLGIPPMHFPPPSEVGRQVGERVDALMGPEDEYVFSSNTELALAHGLSTPGFDWRQVGLGFMLDRPRSERLAALKTRARRSLDPEALRGLEVKWMVLSPGDRAGLNADGRNRLADPKRFEPRGEIEVRGQVRYIYRVLEGALAR